MKVEVDTKLKAPVESNEAPVSSVIVGDTFQWGPKLYLRSNFSGYTPTMGFVLATVVQTGEIEEISDGTIVTKVAYKAVPV